MKRELNLTWGRHGRDGRKHTEWHAPCGCAYHPDPAPHIHPCLEHGLAATDAVLAAADKAAVATWKKTDSCIGNKLMIAGCFKHFLPQEPNA